MKRIITALLILALCLGLYACGGPNPKKEILGEWKLLNGSDVLIFHEDGTLTRDDETLDWWYDTDGARYCISYYGMTFNFVIKTEDDFRFFTIDGANYYPAADCEKAIAANKK